MIDARDSQRITIYQSFEPDREFPNNDFDSMDPLRSLPRSWLEEAEMWADLFTRVFPYDHGWRTVLEDPPISLVEEVEGYLKNLSSGGGTT